MEQISNPSGMIQNVDVLAIKQMSAPHHSLENKINTAFIEIEWGIFSFIFQFLHFALTAKPSNQAETDEKLFVTQEQGYCFDG